MAITIYHNPKCGTSRNVLAMIRASGEEPEVIESLKTPPGRDTDVLNTEDGRWRFLSWAGGDDPE